MVMPPQGKASRIKQIASTGLRRVSRVAVTLRTDTMPPAALRRKTQIPPKTADWKNNNLNPAA